MELKQMQIVTFAMIKYPCSRDFYQAGSCEEHLLSLEQYIKLAWTAAHGPSEAANPCFGDCFLNSMLGSTAEP